MSASSFKLLCSSLAVAAVVGLALAPGKSVGADDTVRPEVGAPLKQAADLLKANKFKEALAKLREAEAVGGRTAYENYMIERMRGSAASGAGDNELAIKSFESVLGSGKISAADQLRMVEALAGAYYRGRDYPNALKYAARYLKDGGTNQQIRTLMIQAYFQSGDFANTAKEALADIQVDEKAGRPPSEEKLQLLANAYLRQKNTAGYVATIEKLLSYYPKKSLWADIISRLQRKPGFADRLSIDVYRLQYATGNLVSTADVMEMAQLSLQAGFPAEAKKIIDEGFASGALGKGAAAEADRQKRLRDLATKRLAENAKALTAAEETTARAAKEGDALFNLGYNYVTSGQAPKGLGMMEEAMKKGNLRREEDSKLRYGVALIQGGQQKKGAQVLKGVKGADGVQDLANLWMIFAR